MRCQKLINDRGQEKCALQMDVVRVFISQSIGRVQSIARQLLADVTADAEELQNHLKAVDGILRHAPINVVAPLRRLSARAIEVGRYPF